MRRMKKQRGRVMKRENERGRETYGGCWFADFSASRRRADSSSHRSNNTGTQHVKIERKGRDKRPRQEGEGKTQCWVQNTSSEKGKEES